MQHDFFYTDFFNSKICITFAYVNCWHWKSRSSCYLAQTCISLATCSLFSSWTINSGDITNCVLICSHVWESYHYHKSVKNALQSLLSIVLDALSVNQLYVADRQSLRVQYNNAFRVLLGLPRICRPSGMFAEVHLNVAPSARQTQPHPECVFFTLGRADIRTLDTSAAVA